MLLSVTWFAIVAVHRAENERPKVRHVVKKKFHRSSAVRLVAAAPEQEQRLGLAPARGRRQLRDRIPPEAVDRLLALRQSEERHLGMDSDKIVQIPKFFRKNRRELRNC